MPIEVAEVLHASIRFRSALETGRGFAIVRAGGASNAGREVASLDRRPGLGQRSPKREGPCCRLRDHRPGRAQGAAFSRHELRDSFTPTIRSHRHPRLRRLLCLQVAKTGGRSQVLSGFRRPQRVVRHDKDVLATLYQPFHIDRRGGLRDGDSPTNPVPHHAMDGTRLLVRYLRYWIEAGHEKIGTPLTPAQRTALDVLMKC